jgi:putative membrane protein
MTAIRRAMLTAAAGLALATSAALPAFAQTAQSAQSTPNNGKPGSAINTDVFVRTAAQANQFEIDSSKLALQRARGDDVKKFAQEMIDDHTKAGQDMQAALQQAGLSMPTAQADKQHQAMLDRMGKASNFDGEYIQAQVKAHQDAVKLFQTYASNGDNAPIRQFASTTLPNLQKHLQHVQELARGQNRKTTSR